MPVANLVLFAGVLGVVMALGSSDRLAAAYGIAVTGTMALTTLLYLAWRSRQSTRSKPLLLLTAAVLLALDLAFFTANLVKVR